MVWHESDSDIEVLFTKLREKETSLDKKIRKLRTYQVNINRLKFTANSEIETVTINGKDTTQRITKFYPPNNYAGNEMNEEYRVSQKAALIVNINEFLGENDE